VEALTVRLGLMNSDEAVERLTEGGWGVVVPCGSFEWHASLPLSTDSIIAERIAEKLAERIGYAYIPLIPYGFSVEHRAFKGTLSLSAELYLSLLKEVLGELVRNGFRNLVVVNGHGGNTGLVEAAVRALRSGNPEVKAVIFDLWSVIDDLLREKLGKALVSRHGGTVEASILFYLAPDIPLKVVKAEVKETVASVKGRRYLIAPWLAQELTLEAEVKADFKLGEAIVKELLSVVEEEVRRKLFKR